MDLSSLSQSFLTSFPVVLVPKSNTTWRRECALTIGGSTTFHREECLTPLPIYQYIYIKEILYSVGK